MADLTPVIETMENRWMRAWVNRDAKALKSLTAKNFILLTASKPPAILDRRSWIEAAIERYLCSSYSFGDIYVRDWGQVALFAASLELKATMDGRDWSERMWVTDIWRRGRVNRGWKLVQRTVSRSDEDPKLRPAIKSLQLWK
jgi:ketosteroid isomerase-like protein